MTPAGTSNELDVQNGWEENTQKNTHVWIDLHALIVNNFEHRVLRIERINTAVQRCAISRSTEFASQDAAHKGFCWTFPFCVNLHAFLNNFEHKVFSAYSLLMMYKGVLVRALNLHRDQKSLTRTGETWKIP